MSFLKGSDPHYSFAWVSSVDLQSDEAPGCLALPVPLLCSLWDELYKKIIRLLSKWSFWKDIHVLSAKTTKYQLSQMRQSWSSWLFPWLFSRIVSPIQLPGMLQIVGMLRTMGPSCFIALFSLRVQLVSGFWKKLHKERQISPQMVQSMKYFVMLQCLLSEDFKANYKILTYFTLPLEKTFRLTGR